MTTPFPQHYSVFGHSAVYRQPQDGLAQQAADMLAVGAKPSLVADVLHRQNVPVAVKDIYNMRQKIKFKGIVYTAKVNHTRNSCTLTVSCLHGDYATPTPWRYPGGPGTPNPIPL